MLTRKDPPLTPRVQRDPFAFLRDMTADFDRMFADFPLPSFRWRLPFRQVDEQALWYPGIDVFEKDGRLVAKIDLPGMKKEDVKVEVTDGQFAISGERKREVEDTNENFYRCEREYGSFYRAIPLPQGVKFEDVKATFLNGVLEVSVPLPAKPETKVRTVAIEEPIKSGKAAA